MGKLEQGFAWVGLAVFATSLACASRAPTESNHAPQASSPTPRKPVPESAEPSTASPATTVSSAQHRPEPAPLGPPRLPASRDDQAVQIQRVIRSHMRGVRRCYERALRRDPNLEVRPRKLQWTIDQDGSVRNVEVSVPGAPELENCLKNEVSRWRFQPPKSGTVVISYPLP